MKTLKAQRGGLVAKVLALNTPGSLMGTGSNPGIPASHPAPCLWPGKAIKDGPKPWDSASLWETQKLTQGSWLWISSAPAVAGTWGVNQQTEDLPLCISFQ